MLDQDKKEVTLELAGVFVYLHGNKPVTDFLLGALEAGDDGCITVDRYMETSVPGVYVAGDVRSTPLRQIATAVGDGAIAAISAEHYIDNFE